MPDPKTGTGKKPKGSGRRQILTVGEQRAKVMGKTEVVNIFKRGKERIRRQNARKKKK